MTYLDRVGRFGFESQRCRDDKRVDRPAARFGPPAPVQCRAARGLLAWTQYDLAEGAGIGIVTVHQFEAGMITEASFIEKRDDVDLVIDMDGYGPADIKEVKYRRYGAAEYAPYGGIKVFLEHDPDPLTEQQLLSLQPRPALIVYQ